MRRDFARGAPLPLRLCPLSRRGFHADEMRPIRATVNPSIGAKLAAIGGVTACCYIAAMGRKRRHLLCDAIAPDLEQQCGAWLAANPNPDNEFDRVGREALQRYSRCAQQTQGEGEDAPSTRRMTPTAHALIMPLRRQRLSVYLLPPTRCIGSAPKFLALRHLAREYASSSE